MSSSSSNQIVPWSNFLHILIEEFLPNVYLSNRDIQTIVTKMNTLAAKLCISTDDQINEQISVIAETINDLKNVDPQVKMQLLIMNGKFSLMIMDTCLVLKRMANERAISENERAISENKRIISENETKTMIAQLNIKQNENEAKSAEEKRWIMRNTTGLIASGAMAAATTYGTSNVLDFRHYITGSLRVGMEWLSNPFGACVIESSGGTGIFGSLFGSVKNERQATALCDIMDNLGNGLGGVLNKILLLESGAFILFFIVAFLFYFILWKIVNVKEASFLGVSAKFHFAGKKSNFHSIPK